MRGCVVNHPRCLIGDQSGAVGGRELVDQCVVFTADEVETAEEAVACHEVALTQQQVVAQGAVSLTVAVLAHEVVSHVEALEAFERRGFVSIATVADDHARVLVAGPRHGAEPLARRGFGRGLSKQNPFGARSFHAERHGELLTAHVARRLGDVGHVETCVALLLVDFILDVFHHILGVVVALLYYDDDLIVNGIVLVEQQRKIGRQRLSLVVGREDDGDRNCCGFRRLAFSIVYVGRFLLRLPEAEEGGEQDRDHGDNEQRSRTDDGKIVDDKYIVH